jgi:hypothetical protein
VFSFFLQRCFLLLSLIYSLTIYYFTVYEVDTYNDFQDDQGNRLCIGELQYISKKGKQALSFVDNVPARDVKSALSLVVRLLLEHSNVPEEKSCIVDLLMKDIKKSSKDETIHANSIGKVNASFAKFVDFIAMSLLFDAFIYHNAQAAPAPWAGRHLSIKEQNLFQQNQIVLVKFCLRHNEDQAWKLFGQRQFGTVGWTVSNLDSFWGSSVRY